MADDMIKINGYTLGIDEQGAYGSIFDDESESEIPEPIDLTPPPPPGLIVDDNDANE
jgi:hypothetical protein